MNSNERNQMTDTQFDKALTIAVRLRDTRETMRDYFGKEYAARVAPWRALVRRCVASAKCRPLQAPMLLQAEARKQGNDIENLPLLMLISAAVDEAEGVQDYAQDQPHAG